MDAKPHRRALLSPIHWFVVGLVSLGLAFLFNLNFRIPHYWGGSRGVRAVYGDRAEITVKALRQDFNRTDLIILGSSSIQLGFHNEQILSNMLFEQTGEQKTFCKITAAALTYPEMLFVLRQAKIQKNQLYFIFVTPSVFVRDMVQVERHITLWPVYLDNEAFFSRYGEQLPGIRKLSEQNFTGIRRLYSYNRTRVIWLFSLIHEWTQRRLYGIRPENDDEDFYHRNNKNGSSRIEDIISWEIRDIRKKMEAYYRKDVDTLQFFLSEILTRIQSAGSDAVLIEYPNILQKGHLTEWQGDYQSRISEISRRFNIPYYNLNDETDLVMDDFAHTAHMNKKGRDKWSRFFIQWLTESKLYDR